MPNNGINSAGDSSSNFRLLNFSLILRMCIKILASFQFQSSRHQLREKLEKLGLFCAVTISTSFENENVTSTVYGHFLR